MQVSRLRRSVNVSYVKTFECLEFNFKVDSSFICTLEATCDATYRFYLTHWWVSHTRLTTAAAATSADGKAASCLPPLLSSSDANWVSSSASSGRRAPANQRREKSDRNLHKSAWLMRRKFTFSSAMK